MRRNPMGYRYNPWRRNAEDDKKKRGKKKKKKTPLPPFRERTTYREERRKSAGQTARSTPEEGFFFGADPTTRKKLRKTKKKKGTVRLDELNLEATRRKGAPEKVGKTMKLIDMAMGISDIFAPDDPRLPKRKKPKRRKQEKKRRMIKKMVSHAKKEGVTIQKLASNLKRKLREFKNRMKDPEAVRQAMGWLDDIEDIDDDDDSSVEEAMGWLDDVD